MEDIRNKILAGLNKAKGIPLSQIEQSGFTLIELMIVIVIIGILGAIVLYNFDIMAIVIAIGVIIGLVTAGAAIVAGFGSVKSMKEHRDSTTSFSPRPRNNNKKGN